MAGARPPGRAGAGGPGPHSSVPPAARPCSSPAPAGGSRRRRAFRSFRGTGARRWTPRRRRSRVSRCRQAIRRRRTRGPAKAGRRRSPRDGGWTGETAFSGARSAGGGAALESCGPARPDGQGPRRGPVGSVGGPAGHNRIVTAWSRLAHERAPGGRGNHPLTPATCRGPTSPAPHGGMIAGECSAHRTGRLPDAAPFVIYAVRRVMSRSFGFLIARNPPSRAAGVVTAAVLVGPLHADRVPARAGRAGGVAVGRVPAGGAARVDHLGGVAGRADGRDERGRVRLLPPCPRSAG